MCDDAPTAATGSASGTATGSASDTATGSATEPAAPRPTRRRGRTRERLLDAAFDAFAETGVDGTSVETISERAGFTRGAFYSNFAGKEDIVLAVMAREFETRLTDLDDRIDAAVDEADRIGLADRLPWLIRSLLQTDRDDTAWAIVVSDLRLYALRNPSVARALLDLDHEFAARVAVLMDAAAARIGTRFTIPTPELAHLVDAVCAQTCTDAALAGSDRETLMATMSERLATLIAAFLAPNRQG